MFARAIITGIAMVITTVAIPAIADVIAILLDSNGSEEKEQDKSGDPRTAFCRGCRFIGSSTGQKRVNGRG